jgi:hypothetical protein
MPPVRAQGAAVAEVMRSSVVMWVVSTDTRRGVRSSDERDEDRAEAKDDSAQWSRTTAV